MSYQTEKSNYFFKITNIITKVLPGWVFFFLIIKKEKSRKEKDIYGIQINAPKLISEIYKFDGS